MAHSTPSVREPTVHAHEAFGSALRRLLDEIAPWVDTQLSATFPGKDWRAALAARDEAKTGRHRPVDLGDPRRMLRILRDDYFAFSPRLTRTQTAYAHLVYELANTWAHSTSMDPYRVRQGIELMADLLLSLSREEAAAEVLEFAVELDPVRSAAGHAAEPDLDSEDGTEGEDQAEDSGAEAAGRRVAPVGDANDSTEFVPAPWDERRPTWVLDRLPDESAAEVVRAEVEDVIAAEAPILLSRLLYKVARRFGLRKVTAKRTEQIELYVPPHLIRRSANHDKVVWPEGEGPDTYTSYRIPAPNSRRPVSRIPYEEIRNALVELCWARPVGLSPDELVWLVNREFGGQRVTTATGERLRGVIDAAIREGTLRIEMGAVVAARNPEAMEES